MDQISPGMTHPPSRLCPSDLRRRVPCKYWALTILDVSPRNVASSASCTSGQRFACGFLRIRGRPRHPCRPANGSPCRVRRGLSPPSRCALPGAPKKSKAWDRPQALLSRTLSLNCDPGSSRLLRRNSCAPRDQPVKRPVLPQTRHIRRRHCRRRPPFREDMTDSRKFGQCHQREQGCHAKFFCLTSIWSIAPGRR